MPPSHRSGLPLRSLLLLASLALLAPVRAAAGPVGVYEVVDLKGQSYQVAAFAFTRDGLRVATPAGVRTLAFDDVDWYETFHRNVRSNSTNLVAFKSGSILRFDRFERVDGRIKLAMSGGGEIVLAESLIDFERSVREGAMVNLPADAGATVAVSKSTGAGWSDDEPTGADGGPGAAGRSRRSGNSLVSRRRAALGQPMSPEDGTTAESSGDMSPEDQGLAPLDTEPPSDQTAPPGGPFGNRPPPTSRRGPFGRPSPGSTDSPSDGQEAGQVTVSVSTDYAGPIGGIQLTLAFPPNLQVVEPVMFTGFAGNWLATPNTTISGQVIIAGAAPPGTSIGGGEFLRLTFVWSGMAPSRQAFRIADLKVSAEDSTTVPDFRATVDVQ